MTKHQPVFKKKDGMDWDMSKLSSHLQSLCVSLIFILLLLIIKHTVKASQGRENKVQQKKSAGLILEEKDWHDTQFC